MVLLLALAQAGRVYLYPWLSDESISFPQLPPAPQLLLTPSSLPSPPLEAAREPAIAPAEPPSAAPIATTVGAGVRYAIDVAMFQSTQRAGRLVEELVAANYPAYQIELDLGSRGRAYVVMVGPYPAPADAETDLARIQQLPGHADARIIAATAKFLPQ